MPDIVTAARLAEIKAEAKRWGIDAPKQTLDFIATLEQAVKLVRVMNDGRNEYGLTFVPVSATEFLGEFDR